MRAIHRQNSSYEVVDKLSFFDISVRIFFVLFSRSFIKWSTPYVQSNDGKSLSEPCGYFEKKKKTFCNFNKLKFGAIERATTEYKTN